MPMTEHRPYRTRTSVLFASHAPRAVILRRGPRSRHRLIVWNTNDDTFEAVHELKSSWPDVEVVAGNIATADGAALTAFFGKGSRITGTLVFEGPSRIEGHVEGEVSAQDTLTVGESAVVNARIKGLMIVIHGTVTGDVVAQTRLEIRAPGKVIGDVTTPTLVIDEGAILEGRCSMRSGASAEKTGGVPIPPIANATQREAG